MSAVTSSSKRLKKVYFCPHCEEEVSKTFFQHKKIFYNPATGKWQNNECQDDVEETLHDFNFSSASESSDNG